MKTKTSTHQIKTNITRTLNRATGTQIMHGERWYNEARLKAQHIAHSAGIDLATAADVISILSPANEWTNNVQEALKLAFSYKREPQQLELLTFVTYKNNVNKAIQRLKGHPVLKGASKTAPKTYRFAKNIQGDEEPVTIDRHMLRAVNFPEGEGLNLGSYLHMEEAFQDYAATRTDWTPAQLQAIIWTVQRETPLT
jgi:hypothetical protein